MKKSVSTVGICCRGISFQLFKHSWEKAGLKPDKICKDKEYDMYYVVFDSIVWDDARNKKTKGMFEIMDILDLLDETRLLSMKQADKSSKLRSELIAPILHTLFNMASDAGIEISDDYTARIWDDALTSNMAGVCGFLYKCIEINHGHDAETVYVRGCKYLRDKEFCVKQMLVLPDDAEPYV